MDRMKNYKHIIWDWNGTLLDDVDIVIEAMNRLLEKRGLPLLDLHRYKGIFTFPVKDYYSRLGFDFDKEPFEMLASEFISEFNSRKYRFRLHDGAEEVLNSVKSMGIGQSILSASLERELKEDIGRLNIGGYFMRTAGLDNHYARSKVERGRRLLGDLGLEPREVLLIGDTLHDCEVSGEIDCDCLLVCGGHQSYERISGCRAGVVETIPEVIGFIKGEAIA